MKRNYKVRFHLAKGKNFMKWQVRSINGEVSYYDPFKVSLRLSNCFLRNQLGTSNKIFLGANKTVCAWVECESVSIESIGDAEGCHLRYNPKVEPNWTLEGKVVDGQEFNEILSYNRSLYTKL
jgi:hypothetical protein